MPLLLAAVQHSNMLLDRQLQQVAAAGPLLWWIVLLPLRLCRQAYHSRQSDPCSSSSSNSSSNPCY
jgi:hypothetical protein